MESSRRGFVLAIVAAAATGWPTDAEARKRKRKGRRIRLTSPTFGRGTTDDDYCPCNGG